MVEWRAYNLVVHLLSGDGGPHFFWFFEHQNAKIIRHSSAQNQLLAELMMRG